MQAREADRVVPDALLTQPPRRVTSNSNINSARDNNKFSDFRSDIEMALPGPKSPSCRPFWFRTNKPESPDIKPIERATYRDRAFTLKFISSALISSAPFAIKKLISCICTRQRRRRSVGYASPTGRQRRRIHVTPARP